jgi:branched-subunit amino acid aminotransferase/4-amino-4-deoxychorismate lyase
MTGSWCSLNGELIPARQAVIGVDDIDFTYGYGVYETLKVRGKILYFPELHAERLLHSASIIGLASEWESRMGKSISPGDIAAWIRDLVRANETADANVKMLLAGPRLYIMTLNPLFPGRKLYRDGAAAIIVDGERVFPRAKTLNMLVSALAFRKAQEAGAYDALLCGRDGFITEGTRTNLFFTGGGRLYTPPSDTALTGVTRLTLERALQEEGIPLEEKPLPRAELSRWEGYFLTSTSTKVMPLVRAGELAFGIPDSTRRVMRLYDAWLRRYADLQEPVF